MAGIFKVTFFFNSGVSGWTENLYSNLGNGEGALISARLIAKERMLLCGTGVDMPYIRVSDITVRGDVQLNESAGYTTRSSGPLGGMIRIIPIEQTPADVSWTSSIVSLSKDNVVRGRIFMRGLPDVFFSNARRFVPSNAWIAGFDDWAATFRAGGGMWGVVRKAQSTPANTFGIASATSVLGGNLTLVMRPGFAAAAGQVVAIRGLKSDLGTLSGNLEVISWVPPTLVVAKTFGLFQPVFKPLTGTAQVIVPAFLGDCVASWGQGTERKAGRPFGSPVGRRKKPLLLR